MPSRRNSPHPDLILSRRQRVYLSTICAAALKRGQSSLATHASALPRPPCGLVFCGRLIGSAASARLGIQCEARALPDTDSHSRQGAWLLYLGLDLGTSGLKALLLDDGQSIIATSDAPLTVQRAHFGWSEQDPAAWISAAESAVDQQIVVMRYRIGLDIQGRRTIRHHQSAPPSGPPAAAPTGAPPTAPPTIPAPPTHASPAGGPPSANALDDSLPPPPAPRGRPALQARRRSHPAPALSSPALSS